MTALTRESLLRALQDCGIEKGDTVLVHSDIRGFGLPEGMSTREEMLNFYADTLLEAVGAEGTIAVPAYFYEYARQGLPFDVEHSPVSLPLGSFSQFIAAKENAVRSLNPLQSIAAIGKNAFELCGGSSMSGYGPGSPWQRLRELKGKMLFLGTSLQSMTFVHYIEQQVGVPHLYVKSYPYPVLKNGKRLRGQPSSSVRYLDFEVNYLLDRFEHDLNTRGAIKKNTSLRVPIEVLSAEEAYKIGLEGLEQSSSYFLKHPPAFILGKIPLDGIIGEGI